MPNRSSLRRLVAHCFTLALVTCSLACGEEEADAAPGPGVAEQSSPAPEATYEHPVAPGYEFGTCWHVSGRGRTASLEEETFLGFSGSEVIAHFNQRAHGTLAWADGTQARIVLTLSSSAETTFEYDDYPPGEGHCAPSLQLKRATLTIAIHGGPHEQTVTGEDLDVFATTDGKLGIANIGLSAELAPESLTSPLLDAAQAAHPEHDKRAIKLDFDLSESGWRASCPDGQTISDDPLEDCNRYDGTLVYESYPKELWDDHHNVDSSMIFNRALATWTWEASDPKD